MHFRVILEGNGLRAVLCGKFFDGAVCFFGLLGSNAAEGHIDGKTLMNELSLGHVICFNDALIGIHYLVGYSSCHKVTSLDIEHRGVCFAGRNLSTDDIGVIDGSLGLYPADHIAGTLVTCG